MTTTWSLRYARRLALLLACFAGMAGAQPEPVVISDGEFAESDWQVDVTTFTGASASAQREADGGNPGAYRRMAHTLPPPSSLSANHLYLGATWDPCVQGPIAGFDYREDQIEFAPPFNGAAVGSGFMLVRNGTRYFYVGSELNPFTNLSFRTAGRRCIKAQDLANGGNVPDLTSCGTIQFGFLRSNTNNNTTSTGGIVVTHGIDNWKVIVYPAPNDTCTGGPACLTDAECDDADACTVDACADDVCSHAPKSCDDSNECTADSCAGGACQNVLTADFALVDAKIEGLLGILGGAACGDEPLVRALAKPIRKKLGKARKRLARADDATRAALITKLLGRADSLLGVAEGLLAQGVNGMLVSATCAAELQGLIGEIRQCVAGLPQPG